LNEHRRGGSVHAHGVIVIRHVMELTNLIQSGNTTVRDLCVPSCFLPVFFPF
jgi:hypothetical protein